MSNNANMKIVCKTERAYANTTAVLNFIGSGEYIADDEKKTIELNVSSWHFSTVIECIHSQFKYELGERAWKNEIDIFETNCSGKEFKIDKSEKKEKPEKRVVHLIFGELAVKRIDDFDKLIESLECYCEGDYVIREFDTEAEERAYMQALEDLNGWDDYDTLESHYNDDEIEEFDKRHNKSTNKS